MEPTSVRALLAQHHQDAIGWALHLCRYDIDEAENIVQTAYVNILSRDAVFAGHASFRTWLFAIIRNTAADLRRREWLRRLHLIPSPLLADKPDNAPRPDEKFADDERSRHLRVALMRLPRRQRETLQLVFYHGMSIGEAAQIMNVSLGSARQHYERGKQHLRARLAAENRA